jgi:hypothetical protein
MAERFVIKITTEGKMQFIYNDRLRGLLTHGKSKVVRASHVEPAPEGGWTADMEPVGGPILGPFPLRSEALAAEVAWIEKNVLGGADVLRPSE